MKILIAAKHPPGGRMPIGGVQTWSRTIGAELERRGHEVAFWGPEWPLPDMSFDGGILANLKYTAPAAALCRRVVRICHGIIPDEKGGRDFLATSEEVRDRWGCRGIIRQPLDLEFWRPANQERTLLTRHSYRAGLDYLPGLANALGLGFTHLRTESQETVRDTLRRSAVVVATGRAAVEAMACGAAVVIADDRPYQGPLLDPDTLGAMRRNYSGRGGVRPDTTTMMAAIEAAIGKGSQRSHVVQYHDVRNVIKELLCYISSPLPAPARVRGASANA